MKAKCTKIYSSYLYGISVTKSIPNGSVKKDIIRAISFLESVVVTIYRKAGFITSAMNYSRTFVLCLLC